MAHLLHSKRMRGPSMSSNRKVVRTDLEMQNVYKTTQKSQDRLWEILRGPETGCRELSTPLEPWIKYIRGEFCTYKNHILPLTEHVGFPSECEDPLDIVASIASILQTLGNDSENSPTVSISSIASDLRAKYQERHNPDPISNEVQGAIFAIIGWLSMIYQPSFTGTSSDACLAVPDTLLEAGVRNKVPLKSITGLPIGMAMRTVGQLFPVPRHLNHNKLIISQGSATSDRLYAPSCSAYSLQTFGKINFEWTDTISSHLTFHQVARKVLLFRFPSLCALSIWSDGASLFDVIMREYYNVPDPHSTLTKGLNQEIILSYRVLFANSKSRAIFNKLLPVHSDVDPLLQLLCTKKTKGLKQLPARYWPTFCGSDDPERPKLMEQSNYNLNTDFPILADRFAILQDYMQLQTSTRKRDLWRDRRYKDKWYALWPVLIFAAASVILSLLQVCLAGAQLAYAVLAYRKPAS